MTSKILQGGSSWSKKSYTMEHRLKLIFRKGKVLREFHNLAKALTTGSASSTRCIGEECIKSPRVTTTHNQFAMKNATRNNHLSREITAVTHLLLRSPAFTDILHPQVQKHIRQFHTSGFKMRQSSNPHDRDQDKKQKNEDEDEEDEKDKEKANMERMLITFVLPLMVILTFATTGTMFFKNARSQQYISLNEFLANVLTTGEVKYVHLLSHHTSEGKDNTAFVVLHDGAIIKGKPVPPGTHFVISVPHGVDFEEKIRETEDYLGVAMKDRITIEYSDSSALSSTIWLFVLTLAILGIGLFRRYGKNPGKLKIDNVFSGIRQAKFTRMDQAVRGSKVKAISFKDVAGLKEAKVEITEFVDYLTNPSRYQTLGAKTPRGAILLGPPGCGKTLLALALSTEAKVPFLAMAGSEFVEMIGGVGAARVRSLFKEARARAPCIIYIDEIDAIGRSRGGSGSGGRGEDEHTLNQLLVEMDGMGTKEGVIMIAATNRPDILDKALLRPGRFDRHILIDLPTLEEREEIFMVYLNKLKLAQPASAYAKPLSKLTPGMSGADINNICNEAAIHAARDGNKVIDTKNFEYAVERVIAGVEKRTSQLSPTEKKMVAYHEAGHALVGWMLKHTDALLKISIIPRTNNALGFTQYLPSDQKLHSKEELFEKMCMALGGRAAESLVFNHVSTGAHDDLNRVTEMAYNQIRSYGMNDRVGHLSFPSDKEQSGAKPYSQRLAQIMDEEARSLVAKAFLHTQRVLQDNRDKLNKLAISLLEKEALSYEDVEALIGPPPHGVKNTIEAEGWKGQVEEDEDIGDRQTSTSKAKKSSRHTRK